MPPGAAGAGIACPVAANTGAAAVPRGPSQHPRWDRPWTKAAAQGLLRGGGVVQTLLVPS